MSSSTSIRGAAGRRVGILLLGLALACVGALSFAGSQAKAVPFSMDFTNGQVNLGFAFKGAEILPAPTTLGSTPLPDLWEARATQSTPGTGTEPNSADSFKPVGCLSPVTFTVTANSGRSCVAALHVQSAEPVPVVLSMAGSGLYTSTTDPVPLWYQARVERGELALLVFHLGVEHQLGVA